MDSPENIQYKLSSKLISSDVANETVILDYEGGKYFGLDGVGSFVWSLLQKEGPLSLTVIAHRVMEEYDVTESACLEDLKTLFADLRKNGLIETST